jgi:TorA maturation chaperone TorD
METIRATANQARATAYRLLSACFYQPETAFLEEDVFGQLLEALTVLDDDLGEQADQLGKAFRRANLDELLLDYSRLFLGPFNILAKPYGSVYLDGENVTMGDSTLNAMACYREGKFELAEDFREVPDHVAVELEFLYLLTFRENDALAQGSSVDFGLAAQQKTVFLKNHLGRWVGAFCERVRLGAETDFYRMLANLAENFVLREKARGVDYAA